MRGVVNYSGILSWIYDVLRFAFLKDDSNCIVKVRLKRARLEIEREVQLFFLYLWQCLEEFLNGCACCSSPVG